MGNRWPERAVHSRAAGGPCANPVGSSTRFMDSRYHVGTRGRFCSRRWRAGPDAGPTVGPPRVVSRSSLLGRAHLAVHFDCVRGARSASSRFCKSCCRLVLAHANHARPRDFHSVHRHGIGCRACMGGSGSMDGPRGVSRHDIRCFSFWLYWALRDSGRTLIGHDQPWDARCRCVNMDWRVSCNS